LSLRHPGGRRRQPYKALVNLPAFSESIYPYVILVDAGINPTIYPSLILVDVGIKPTFSLFLQFPHNTIHHTLFHYTRIDRKNICEAMRFPKRSKPKSRKIPKPYVGATSN